MSQISTAASVAAALIEAAHWAQKGDFDTAKAGIARAITILQSEPRPDGPPAPEAIRGGLAAWQARRVANYIEANLAAKIRIEDLAQLVGLSSSHFSRVFKCSFGMSTHAFLTLRRIEFARELMLTTPHPLSEIALACGMGDQSHFTRTFTRIVGESPFSWRRNQSSISATSDSVSSIAPRASLDGHPPVPMADYPTHTDVLEITHAHTGTRATLPLLQLCLAPRGDR